jgi:predicted ABC-type ATPase
LKEYILFAGANGAGKTTLYYLPKVTSMPRINIDEILADDGGEWSNPNEAFLALRKGIDIIDNKLSEGLPICQETNLADKMILSLIRSAHVLGYKIKMYYVGVETPDICVKRILERVLRGGRGLSESAVRRKYDISLENLKKVADVCDEIYVFDNSEIFNLIAIIKHGLITFRNDGGVSWFRKNFP